MKKYSFGLLAFLFAALASFTTLPSKKQPVAGKALTDYGYFHFIGTTVAEETDPWKWVYVSEDSPGEYVCEDEEMLCTLRAPVTTVSSQQVIDVNALQNAPNFLPRSGDNQISQQAYQLIP